MTQSLGRLLLVKTDNGIKKDVKEKAQIALFYLCIMIGKLGTGKEVVINILVDA